ncbi:MAG: hypothetical protein KatS3mg003_1569 [Candidatus Nitrosocaldaceae archaeon]|nr:MAG: hypothetical protein KatS3mg003_1569 [Candidatus Nitrosocaldaceae archaeon]
MKIVTLGIDECKALGDPIRAMIINILSHKILTVDDIVNELTKHNYKKSVPTIRHHIDVLKNAGLIDIAYTKEKRGTLEKYYKSNIHFLGFNARKIDASNIDDISRKLLKIINVIEKRYIEDSNDSCEYCNTDHSKEYIIAELINQALTKALITPSS